MRSGIDKVVLFQEVKNRPGVNVRMNHIESVRNAIADDVKRGKKEQCSTTRGHIRR